MKGKKKQKGEGGAEQRKDGKQMKEIGSTIGRDRLGKKGSGGLIHVHFTNLVRAKAYMLERQGVGVPVRLGRL